MMWARPRYRHASQALRLVAGALILLIPAFVLYPSVHHFADRGLRRLVEEEYARQATDQRAELQKKLSEVLQQIDRSAIPNLAQPPTRQNSSVLAFELWSKTDLASERLASSFELYGPNGLLVSRFALDLPDYIPATEKWVEPSCDWEIFEEASPFGSEERRLFHAGRGVCEGDADTPTGGSIVVNVMLDYDALPFITVRNPYNELIRPPNTLPQEGMAGRAVQFVVYGWGRGSLYSSNTRAWPLDETLLGTIAQSRRPFWTSMTRRRTELLDLHSERPRRHLRDRLPRHYAARSPDQPRGADDAGRPHVRGAADPGVVGLGAQRDHGVLGPRAAAGSQGQLLPEAVSRISRRVRPAGDGAGVCDTHILRAAAPVERAVRCGPRGLHRPARRRGVRRPAAARVGIDARRQHHGVAEPRHRSGRQPVSGPDAAVRRANGTCLPRACCRSAHRGTSIARSSSTGCPITSAWRSSAPSRTFSPQRRSASRKGAPFSRCRSRFASRKSIGRSTRSIAGCCLRP